MSDASKAGAGRFSCPACHATVDVDYQAKNVRCVCGRLFYFVTCPKCGAAQQLEGGKTRKCRNCHSTLRSWRNPPLTHFSAMIGKDSSASAGLPGDEAPREVLGPFLVLDGAGWAPTIGSGGYLYVYADRIALGLPGAVSILPLDSLTDVRVSGQSVITGGGFFGGGFGAKGAVEGMLISTVLNGLTTKKSKWATIGIVADGGWVDLRLDNYDVLSVRNTLRVLSDRVIANQAANQRSPLSESGPEQDFVSSLDRLIEHRNSGVLTEEQFEAAKQRLLSA